MWGPGLLVGSVCSAIWGTNPGSRNQEARAGPSGRGGDLECQSFIANSHAWVDSEVSICLGQTCLCGIVMVIASMTEEGPEALVALESEKQWGCWMCGDTHLKV